MLAICGAQLGMSTTYAMSDIELTPSASPKSAMPIGRPMAMSDPNATSRMTIAAIRPISSPTPVCASSNEKNRSPPISIWSGEPSRSSAPSSLRFSRSPASSSSITGYWMRIERDAGRPAARAPDGSLVPSTLGRAATRDWTSASAVCAAESKKVAPSSSRRQDHLCGQPGSVRLGLRQQVDRLLRVEPGHRRTSPPARGRTSRRRR